MRLQTVVKLGLGVAVAGLAGVVSTSIIKANYKKEAYNNFKSSADYVEFRRGVEDMLLEGKVTSSYYDAVCNDKDTIIEIMKLVSPEDYQNYENQLVSYNPYIATSAVTAGVVGTITFSIATFGLISNGNMGDVEETVRSDLEEKRRAEEIEANFKRDKLHIVK